MTQDKVALVDDEDYDKLMKCEWRYNCGGYAVLAKQKNNPFEATLMHRIIIGNIPKGMEVDHINGNGLDNRKCNLRHCTHAQNVHNQRTQTRCKSSRYKGVHWHERANGWEVNIKLSGKQIYVGRFEREEDAGMAYDKKARELHGEFARCNFGEK